MKSLRQPKQRDGLTTEEYNSETFGKTDSSDELKEYNKKNQEGVNLICQLIKTQLKGARYSPHAKENGQIQNPSTECENNNTTDQDIIGNRTCRGQMVDQESGQGHTTLTRNYGFHTNDQHFQHVTFRGTNPECPVDHSQMGRMSGQHTHQGQTAGQHLLQDNLFNQQSRQSQEFGQQSLKGNAFAQQSKQRNFFDQQFQQGKGNIFGQQQQKRNFFGNGPQEESVFGSRLQESDVSRRQEQEHLFNQNQHQRDLFSQPLCPNETSGFQPQMVQNNNYVQNSSNPPGTSLQFPQYSAEQHLIKQLSQQMTQEIGKQFTEQVIQPFTQEMAKQLLNEITGMDHFTQQQSMQQISKRLSQQLSQQFQMKNLEQFWPPSETVRQAAESFEGENDNRPEPGKSTKRSHANEEKMCKICMENEIGVVFTPCGHLCCCISCSTFDICPICRTEVTGCVRTFIP